MVKFTVGLLVLMLSSCDPFSDVKHIEVDLGNQSVFILVKTWGIGSAHTKVVISKNKRVDDDDLDLKETGSFIYKVQNGQMVLHTWKHFNISPDFTSLVTLKVHEPWDFVQLAEEVRSNKVQDLTLIEVDEILISARTRAKVSEAGP